MYEAEVCDFIISQNQLFAFKKHTKIIIYVLATFPEYECLKKKNSSAVIYVTLCLYVIDYCRVVKSITCT